MSGYVYTGRGMDMSIGVCLGMQYNRDRCLGMCIGVNVWVCIGVNVYAIGIDVWVYV